MDSFEDSNDADVSSLEMLKKFVSEFKIDVNLKLTPNERRELLKLLYKYKNILLEISQTSKLIKVFNFIWNQKINV